MSSTRSTGFLASGSTVLAAALDLIEGKVLEGLRHGFFSVTVDGVIGKGERRELTVRSAISHRFVVQKEDLPK